MKTENLYLNKSCVFGTLYIHIFMYPKFCLLKKKLWSCKLGGPTIQISNIELLDITTSIVETVI